VRRDHNRLYSRHFAVSSILQWLNKTLKKDAAEIPPDVLFKAVNGGLDGLEPQQEYGNVPRPIPSPRPEAELLVVFHSPKPNLQRLSLHHGIEQVGVTSDKVAQNGPAELVPNIR
jgi:hypothetical protein